MEIYSTVLWHLHAEVQLSTLAQELVSEDRNSPAAWCATGNLFSAQTEHETAIKFFQRAIQVRRLFVHFNIDGDFNFRFTFFYVVINLSVILEMQVLFFKCIGRSQFPICLHTAWS